MKRLEALGCCTESSAVSYEHCHNHRRRPPSRCLDRRGRLRRDQGRHRIASPVPPQLSWGALSIMANGQSRPQRHRLDEYGDQERRTRKASVERTRHAGRHRRPRRVPLLAARRMDHRPAPEEQRWPRHVLMNVNDFEDGGPGTPRVRSTAFQSRSLRTRPCGSSDRPCGTSMGS